MVTEGNCGINCIIKMAGIKHEGKCKGEEEEEMKEGTGNTMKEEIGKRRGRGQCAWSITVHEKKQENREK